MKTITELQAQLRESAARLERLSGDVAALQKKEAKKGLDFGRIETAGKRYPLAGHSLKGQASDLQQGYFTLIGAMLLLDCKRPENGWLFVQRLLKTAGCSSKLEALQAAAARLTIEQLDQITKKIITKELQTPILVDLMLVYLACEGSKAAKDYIASVAELLDVHTGQVKELVELAGLIVQKDPEKLGRFLKKGHSVDLGAVRGYIFDIFPDIVPCNAPYIIQIYGDTMYVYGDGKIPIEQKVGETIGFDSNIRRIEMYNAVFTETPLWLKFGNTLLLHGCTIRDINLSQGAFLCQNIHKVDICDCHFDSLKSEYCTVDFCDIDTLRIQGSTFSDIRGTVYYSDTWYFENIKQGCLENVTAKEISGYCWMYNNAGSNLTAKNCFYSQCSGKTSNLPAGFTKKEGL